MKSRMPLDLLAWYVRFCLLIASMENKMGSPCYLSWCILCVRLAQNKNIVSRWPSLVRLGWTFECRKELTLLFSVSSTWTNSFNHLFACLPLALPSNKQKTTENSGTFSNAYNSCFHLLLLKRIKIFKKTQKHSLLRCKASTAKRVELREQTTGWPR